MTARDDDYADIMAEDDAGGVQYWRETAEEAMAECHALQDRVAELERRLGEASDRIDRYIVRHEEDLAWKQRAEQAERDVAALDTALSSRTRQLHDTQLEMHGLLARNAQLEANLLDYWAAHGAVRHVEEPRQVRELRERVAELERQLSCSRDRNAVLASRLEARDKRCDELEAVVTRVRALAKGWRCGLAGVWCANERDVAAASAKDDCADDVLAVLPKEPRT